MSGRNLFSKCVGIVVLAAFSGVAAQSALAAQELRRRASAAAVANAVAVQAPSYAFQAWEFRGSWLGKAGNWEF